MSAHCSGRNWQVFWACWNDSNFSICYEERVYCCCSLFLLSYKWSSACFRPSGCDSWNQTTAHRQPTVNTFTICACVPFRFPELCTCQCIQYTEIIIGYLFSCLCCRHVFILFLKRGANVSGYYPWKGRCVSKRLVFQEHTNWQVFANATEPVVVLQSCFRWN